MGKFEKATKFSVKAGRFLKEILVILVLVFVGYAVVAAMGLKDEVQQLLSKLGAEVLCCIGLVVIVAVDTLISAISSAIRRKRK